MHDRHQVKERTYNPLLCALCKDHDLDKTMIKEKYSVGFMHIHNTY